MPAHAPDQPGEEKISPERSTRTLSGSSPVPKLGYATRRRADDVIGEPSHVERAKVDGTY